MTYLGSSVSLDDLAGELYALTCAMGALSPNGRLDQVTITSCHLDLLAARGDLEDALTALPPPSPPGTCDAHTLAARLRGFGGVLATWSRANSGHHALAAARAAVHVDDAARQLAAALR